MHYIWMHRDWTFTSPPFICWSCNDCMISQCNGLQRWRIWEVIRNLGNLKTKDMRWNLSLYLRHRRVTLPLTYTKLEKMFLGGVVSGAHMTLWVPRLLQSQKSHNITGFNDKKKNRGPSARTMESGEKKGGLKGTIIVKILRNTQEWENSTRYQIFCFLWATGFPEL